MTKRKKNLPKEIIVGPFTFSVHCKRSKMDMTKAKWSDTDPVGFMDPDPQEIHLEPTLADDMLADALLHEVLHAVWLVVGGRENIDKELEEKIIAIISPTLLDTLRRNPELVLFLLGVNDS